MFPPLYKEKEDEEMIAFIKANESSLKASWKGKHETLERTLEVIVEGVKEARRQKIKSVELIWNLAGYINTVSFDLAVTGELLMFESDSWKRRYFARMTAVNIFEASLDLSNMAGKELRKEASSLTGGDDFIKDLSVNLKKLSKFKADNSGWLKEIRLYCAAHRDQNLGEQLRVVSEISPTKVMSVMAEFDAILNELGGVLQKGMNLLPSKINA